MTPRAPLLAFSLVLAAACARPPTPARPPPHRAATAPPLHAGLGGYVRPISTTDARAQRYFDQGLVLVYAFHHEDAIRDFEWAARLDPSCAMCFWGIALASGPHINAPQVDEEHARAGYEAERRARALEGRATAAEKDLIEAMAARWAEDPPSDRRPLDRAYADAMRGAFRAHPDDPDAGALFAEAMMDLRPWDLWTKGGAPQPGTDEIVATLEAVLAKSPEHPGANHFLIHALEASPHPERALAAADRLRTLVPGAGHLVHMPSHVDLRIGHYGAAIDQNEAAIVADDAFARESNDGEDAYAMYRAHDYAFLWYAGMMAGSARAALRGARGMNARLPRAMLEAMPGMADAVVDAPLLAMARFARWDDVLAEPLVEPRFRVASVVGRAVRGMAWLGKGDREGAERELAEAERATGSIAPYALFGNASLARDVAAVATRLLAGEIAADAGDVDRAAAAFAEATGAEDRLAYDEPPDWVLPARQIAGAVLLAAGRADDALRAFAEDLVKNPENGWSLFGTWKALEARRSPDAAAAKARFESAWSRADVVLEGTSAAGFRVRAVR